MRLSLSVLAGLYLAGMALAPPPSFAGNSVPVASIGAPDEASAAKRQRRKRAPMMRSRPGTLIACTRGGCNAIPRGCRIETEMTMDGLPTGFDAVVCPYR